MTAATLRARYHTLFGVFQESNGARATRAAKRKAAEPVEATAGKRVLRAKPRISYATAEYESNEEVDGEEESHDEEVDNLGINQSFFAYLC